MKAVMSAWLKTVLADPVQRQNLRRALLQKPAEAERQVITVGGKAYYVFLAPTRCRNKTPADSPFDEWSPLRAPER